MGIPRKNLLTATILRLLDFDQPFVPLETPYEWMARRGMLNRRQYRDSVRGLRASGYIVLQKKRNGEFLKLTEKGALRVLLQKAQINKVGRWDGKWRVLIFDIPEEFHLVRDSFRKLLKQNNFIKLQASVFISPYPLSRDAIEYLRKVGLSHFVRIMKVEELDNDAELRKKFGL